MTFMDSNLVFSDNQPVSASAISTNVFDLGDLGDSNRQLGYVYINVLCGTALGGAGGELTIDVVTEATEPTDGTGDIILSTIWKVNDANALSGIALLSARIPLTKFDRWVGIYYTDNGSVDAGNVDAWLGMEPINESLLIQNFPS